MALENILKRAFILDEQIRQKSTGTADDLAVRLDISKRQVYNYLRVMQQIGKSHMFDPSLQSYVYLDDPDQEDGAL